MKNVLVLGGSFNPITNAHLDIVNKVYNKLNIDEVYFLIAKNPRWKNSLDISHRYKMLQLALKDFPNYKILDLEIKSNKEVNYTYDSMKEFYSEDKKIYYIIGTDQLNKLDDWYKIDELTKLVTFVLVNREGYTKNIDLIKKYNVLDLNINQNATSSTLIRQYRSKDCPNIVLDYIYKHHLYIEESVESFLNEKRFLHSLSVASLAKEIAKANNYDENKAYLAGLIHDVAKNLDYDFIIEIMNKYFKEYLNKDKNIYHQYVGSYLAKYLYHIEDNEIIEAIKFHTTSKINPAILTKIIFVSDKLDPSRGYDSTKLINMCKDNINLGYIKCLEDNINYLIKHNVNIDKESKEIYMDAIKNTEEFLLKEIYKTIDDKKGSDITIIDMKGHSAIYSYFIIASVDNPRLCHAIAYELEDTLAKYDYPIKHIEGKNDNEWVLVDANEYIIHLFVKEARNKYNLEKLYADLDRITF